MKVLLKTTSLIDLCLHNLISQESEHDVFKEQITAATKENLDKAFILLKNFLEHAHEFDAVNDSLPLSETTEQKKGDLPSNEQEKAALSSEQEEVIYMVGEEHRGIVRASVEPELPS